MSKYAPLGQFLAGQSGREAPMTFGEVERVLGFSLPNSARNWPAWWSNNPGTHVGVKAWRDAGWKASRVDLSAEQVTFVKQGVPMTMAMVTDDAEAGPAASRNRRVESVDFEDLGLTERHCLELVCEELNVDRGSAMRHALREWAVERRRRFVEDLPHARMPSGYDSTDPIRADRDRH